MKSGALNWRLVASSVLGLGLLIVFLQGTGNNLESSQPELESAARSAETTVALTSMEAEGGEISPRIRDILNGETITFSDAELRRWIR
jgi:hypothetical protein